MLLFRSESDPTADPPPPLPTACLPEAQELCIDECEVHIGLAESQQEQSVFFIHGCETRKTLIVMSEDHLVYIDRETFPEFLVHVPFLATHKKLMKRRSP